MSATDPIEDEFFSYAARPKLAEERRRFLRQKAHLPAYCSLNSASASAKLELNMILDISDHGIALQSSPPIEVNRNVNLCLDLSESSAKVDVAGHVIWVDRAGRAGISFPELPADAARRIREWLFLNLLHVSAKHLAEPQAPATQDRIVPVPPPAVAPIDLPFTYTPAAVLATSTVPIATMETDVRLPVSNLESALQLIAERAQTFTRSTGAAIALAENKDDEMVCRANAGADAPPPGARLHVGSGFSGECVRTGLVLRCDDSETDLRVDRESCRALGIRSMLAAPVKSDQKVTGLLEVFSPHPFAFTDVDAQTLQSLSELIADELRQSGRGVPAPVPDVSANSPPSLSSQNWAGDLAEDEEEDEEAAKLPSSEVADVEAKRGSRSRRMLGIAGAVLLLGSLAYWVVPWISSMIRTPARNTTTATVESQQPAIQPPLAEQKPHAAKNPAPPNTLEELRTLAQQGDANAEFALGARFATGEQVKQDYSEAVNWFSKAADQGHVVAQATLGAYYWAGRGVPQDLNQAYFWSILARAGGDEASKYRASVLSARMSRSQIAAVQQQADNWLKQHQIASNTSQAR